MKQKFFKKSDLLIIASILLIGAGIWFYNHYAGSATDLQALIYCDNQLVKTIDLTTAENTTFALEANPDVVFEIRDGSIGFIKSSCPDKICISAGFLDRAGQSAVCLPNKIILKIVSSADSDEPDTIVR